MRAARYLVAQLALVVACSTSYGAAPDDADGGPVVPPQGRTDPTIEILPGSLDFGELPCGTESAGKLITIHNKGSAPAAYNVGVPDGVAFRVQGPAGGSVAANGTTTVQVFAKPGLAGENAADLVLSVGEAVQRIHAKARGAGATFELLPAVVDFGDVRMQSGGGPLDVEVSNKGTAGVVLSSFEQSPDFIVAFDGGSLRIEPGAKAFLHVSLKGAGVESPALQAVLKPVLAQTLCGAPHVLTLKGKRVNSNVTISPADFGTVSCTPQASTKDVVLSNYSASTLSYTASVANMSAFTILSGAMGTVAAGTAMTPVTSIIKVQPKPFGTNVTVIQEDLAIDISGIAAPEGGVRKVPLRADVRGAIVTSTPTQLTNFQSDGSTSDMKMFSTTNTGNQIIYLAWSLDATAGSNSAWTLSPPSSLAPNQTKTTTVSFQPGAPGSYAASARPVRTTDFFGNGAVACTPLSAVMLTGTHP